MGRVTDGTQEGAQIIFGCAGVHDRDAEVQAGGELRLDDIELATLQ